MIIYFETRAYKNVLTQRSIQISPNQPTQIRQVPVAMLQQMFKATSTRAHAAMQTFAPLIESVVDHWRWAWNPCKRRRLPGNAR